MGKLFAVVLAVITVVSAAVFIARIWWLPPDISVLGVGIDHQMAETMIASGVLFVALAAGAGRCSPGSTRDRRDGAADQDVPGGATPMVVVATILVGAEILVLTLVGTKVWARHLSVAARSRTRCTSTSRRSSSPSISATPGRTGNSATAHPELIDDGNGNFFGLDPANDTTARDDIVSGSLVIPVNQPILLTMHAKDVGHAFYVPELRIQQDFVPGLVIPLQFTATQIGKKEIVCTQLCGLGHYNMRAYVDVMPQDQFAQWLKDQAANSRTADRSRTAQPLRTP